MLGGAERREASLAERTSCFLNPQAGVEDLVFISRYHCRTHSKASTILNSQELHSNLHWGVCVCLYVCKSMKEVTKLGNLRDEGAAVI